MIMFEEYIRQGEPDKVEKSQIWQTAIGLQQVDGLTPSAYLFETAKENIEGKITIDEVKYRIDSYYKTKTVRNDDDDRTEEADKVSARIAQILSNDTFSFSPAGYTALHKQLFIGIYKFAGKIRDYNITKSEWVLNGKTVFYASADDIRATLDYDFGQEKAFSYKNLNKQEMVDHIAKFISGLWQIHAFGEGNTRTIAVFAIKYLRSFGFEIDNTQFAKHSWYFRNALVRANYNDYQNNIYATLEYLMNFFDNLLFGESNKLKNRYLRIAIGESVVDKDNSGGQKNENSAQKKFSEKEKKFSVRFSVRFSVNQEKMLSLVEETPVITAKEMAQILGISERAVNKNLAKLKQLKILTREGSDKKGQWIVING
ncbi:MAG: Fic family protein [Dysgonamonadaceae bacterium]|jgi:fido (protein-threonine AMPylation protein)|nr:Fic family protein [Dysgonamonadaceae bacterium]